MQYKENPVGTPWLYGFEYEVQFVAKNPESGKIETLVISGRPALVRGSYGTAVPLSPWAVEEGEQLDNLLDGEDFSLDVGNIELRNRDPHTSISAALLEVNQELERLVTFLTAMNNYEFALFLPKIAFAESVEGTTVGTTKHLNISYGAEGPWQDVQDTHEEAYQQLLVDYPRYFSSATAVIKENLDETVRLHLQLPYTFTDYTGLFAGTAELPDLTLSGPIVWEEATLLGYIGKHGRWRQKNSLV